MPSGVGCARSSRAYRPLPPTAAAAAEVNPNSPLVVARERALADKQERWRRARNWERRRAALLATARAAAALMPISPPQPLCRGMVRLYRGMAREVLVLSDSYAAFESRFKFLTARARPRATAF